MSINTQILYHVDAIRSMTDVFKGLNKEFAFINTMPTEKLLVDNFAVILRRYDFDKANVLFSILYFFLLVLQSESTGSTKLDTVMEDAEKRQSAWSSMDRMLEQSFGFERKLVWFENIVENRGFGLKESPQFSKDPDLIVPIVSWDSSKEAHVVENWNKIKTILDTLVKTYVGNPPSKEIKGQEKKKENGTRKRTDLSLMIENLKKKKGELLNKRDKAKEWSPEIAEAKEELEEEEEIELKSTPVVQPVDEPKKANTLLGWLFKKKDTAPLPMEPPVDTTASQPAPLDRTSPQEEIEPVPEERKKKLKKKLKTTTTKLRKQEEDTTAAEEALAKEKDKKDAEKAAAEAKQKADKAAAEVLAKQEAKQKADKAVAEVLAKQEAKQKADKAAAEAKQKADKAAAEAKRKADKAAAEAKRKEEEALAAAAHKKKAEQEMAAAKKKAEEEEKKRKLEEAAQKKKEEQIKKEEIAEAARKQKEEEALRKKEEEERRASNGKFGVPLSDWEIYKDELRKELRFNEDGIMNRGFKPEKAAQREVLLKKKVTKIAKKFGTTKDTNLQSQMTDELRPLIEEIKREYNHTQSGGRRGTSKRFASRYKSRRKRTGRRRRCLKSRHSNR